MDHHLQQQQQQQHSGARGRGGPVKGTIEQLPSRRLLEDPAARGYVPSYWTSLIISMWGTTELRGSVPDLSLDTITSAGGKK